MEMFNRLVTVRNVNGLMRKFWLLDDHNNVVGVQDLLRGQGTLGLTKEDLVKYTFCVPGGVRHLVDLYCEVFLEDATHRLNYLGCIILYAMIVYDRDWVRLYFMCCVPRKAKHATSGRSTP